jgi:hypothetical protein
MKTVLFLVETRSIFVEGWLFTTLHGVISPKNIIFVVRERGDLGVDGWIILGRISRRWDVGMWTGLGWPRIETDGRRL